MQINVFGDWKGGNGGREGGGRDEGKRGQGWMCGEGDSIIFLFF